MTETQYLLTVLAEECAEVAKAVSKQLRFGPDSWNPDGDSAETNQYQLERELIDLFAVADMLGFHPHYEEYEKDVEAKKAKVTAYMGRSRELGIVD